MRNKKPIELYGYMTAYDAKTLAPFIKKANILSVSYLNPSWLYPRYFTYQIKELEIVFSRKFFGKTKIKTKETLILIEIETRLYERENTTLYKTKIFVNKKTVNKLLFYLNPKFHTNIPKIEVTKR